jgi:Fe-S cluster assembly iron-binding protein IscA
MTASPDAAAAVAAEWQMSSKGQENWEVMMLRVTVTMGGC